MSASHRRLGAFCALVAPGLVVAGCASAPQPGPAVASTTPATAGATVSTRQEGRITLASGASVAYSCTGSGVPAIVLEAGTDTGGTHAYGPAFVDPLASQHRVCTYDRLGTGGSDPAPNVKRTINDLCKVQAEVRDGLKLGDEVILVGQSGGGNIAIWCASKKPKSVVAMAVIEAYHDNPKDLAAEGMRWDDNPENVDWVESSKLLDQMKMPIGDFPVVVISATRADPGGAQNQKYWLGLSTESRQVVVDGGHNLHSEAPGKVTAEILQDIPA